MLGGLLMHANSTPDAVHVLLEWLADTVAQRVADRLPAAHAQAVDDGLIDGPTMAQRLDISLPSLDRYRKAGAIPCVRLGRRVMYSPHDVLEALSQQSAGN